MERVKRITALLLSLALLLPLLPATALGAEVAEEPEAVVQDVETEDLDEPEAESADETETETEDADEAVEETAVEEAEEADEVAVVDEHEDDAAETSTDEDAATEENATTEESTVSGDTDDDSEDSETEAEFQTGDEVYFGRYPQSKVTNTKLINALNELEVDENGDVAIGDYQFRRMTDDDGNYTWFMYEDIKWDVLTEEDGKLFLFSSAMLDAKGLSTSWDGTTWETSVAREWLNSTFLNAAFTAEEQSHIALTYLENGRGNDTEDYLFYLTQSDVKNEAYGFYSNSDRIAETTDYELYVSMSGNCYLLRSTNSILGLANVYAVYNWDGSLSGYMPIDAGYDARPGMWVDASAVSTEKHEYVATYEEVFQEYPIIIIPGIMGSRLFSDTDCSDEVWGFTGGMLSQIGDATTVGNALKISKTLYVRSNTGVTGMFLESGSDLEYGSKDSNKYLVDFLTDEYGEDREIYFYSYDWRQSNTDSAATLKESLDALGITKADFVCHSMGGLVASQFVAAGGESYIHTITTLGTPYEGATKLLNAVLTKHVLDSFKEDTLLYFGGFKTDLKTSFSGVAELAPTLESWTDTSTKNTVIVYSKEYSFKASDYMGLYTPPNEEMTTQDILDYLDDVINNSWLGWTIDGTGLLNKLADVQAEIKADCGYTATKFYFGTTIYPIIEYKNDAESYSSALSTLFGSTLESKMETAKSGFTQLLSMDNAYFAIGNTKRTITGATLKVASNGTVSVQDLSYGLGDGTVPYQSANMLSDRVLSRASYFDLDHSQIGGGGDLEDNEEWQELTAWLKEIIDGGQPTGTTQSTESSSAYTKARVACPVDVTITYNGETLSSCADSLCTETSFGTLDFAGSEGEIKILCLDTNADYEIVLTGTDEGSMEFGLSFYDESGELIEERKVTDVPLTEDTVIYTTADPETETVLEIDTDGDAEIDDTVAVTEPIDPDTCEHEYEKTTIAPTCGYEGCDLYTCPLCGDFYIDNIIPATGEHVYSTTPEWAWATDHSAATAIFTCTGCGDAQTVDAVVTYEVTEAANSVSTGTAVYTATVAFDGETYTDTQTVTVPKIVLTAPTVTALFNSTYGITIRWEAIEGATEYIVWRLNNTTGRWEKCATTTEPNYISTSPVSGTTYYYAIEATDGYTSTGRGPQRYIHYLATPKVSLENTSSGVKISWTKAGGAKSGYQIWRRTADSDYEQIGTVSSINTLTWTDETAALGVRYYYMVRSVSGSARSAYASQYITRLTAPTGISVSNVKNGVQVKWNAVTGAKSYQIWRKTPGGSWARVGSTSDTTYISTGVSSGNTYIFTVKAAYNSSVSAYNTTGKTIMRLAEPTIKLENLSGGLTASWNAVDGAEGYKLYRRSETGSYVLVATLDADELSYTDKAAGAGLVFYYRVQAYNGSYTSSWTSQFNRRIGHTTLTLAKGEDGVVLTWTKSGGCTGYYIYRMNEDGSYTRIKTITSANTLTWTDTDVESGNSYTYYIRGYNGSSLGSYTPKNIDF